MKNKIILITLVLLLIGTLFFFKTNQFADFNKKLESFFTQKSTTSVVLSSSSSSDKIPQIAIQKKIANTIAPDPLKIFRGSHTASSGALSVSGVIAQTNVERKNTDLAILTESKGLDISAQKKADDILKRQYFEHTAPDGKTAKDLITDAKYSFVRVGENLALGDFENNVDLLNAWMHSPGHRANILDNRYQEIGIGIAYGAYQGRTVLVAVQHFGRPRSACPLVETTLKTKVEIDQKKIIKMSESLDALKTYIDTTRTNGGYVDNIVINTYNDSVGKYNALVVESENARNKYNTQVELFNVCLMSLE